MLQRKKKQEMQKDQIRKAVRIALENHVEQISEAIIKELVGSQSSAPSTSIPCEEIQKKLAKSASKKLAFYNVDRHCVHGDSPAMKKKYPLLIFTERNGLRICGTKASLALYPESQDKLDKTETELKNLQY